MVSNLSNALVHAINFMKINAPALRRSDDIYYIFSFFDRNISQTEK